VKNRSPSTEPTIEPQPSPDVEYHVPTPNESPLHAVYSHGSAEGSLKLNELMTLVTKLSKRIGVMEDDLKKTKLTYSAAVTKLILRVKKLETKLKAGTARKRARVVLSEDDEDVEDDSSKQGRKLSDAEVQEKASTETEPIIQEVTPTEVIQDQGSSEKGNSEVSTAGATKGTASEVPVVSTAEVNISTAGRTVTYRRRSEEKRTRKDKGKAIMTEPEPKKKSKKELEQERLSFAEAIRLQEQMDEEQRAQIARDEEIARQWDEEEGQRAMSEAKSSKKIDWNDPSVIRYHALKMKPKTVAQARRNMVKYLKNQGNYKISDFKGMSYNEIRPIFEKVWDFNQHIEPMDLEHGSERMKSPEKIEEEDVDTQKEMKEVSKESGAKRKKSLPRKSTRSTVKRQKMELDDEKEDLKVYLDIVPREDVAEDVESLFIKYPIVDWKTYVLTNFFMYYQIFRGDGSSKNYKVLSETLEDFDRQDVMDLHMLVKERYSASRPEGYDLMLWGDLHTLFKPDEEDEIWKNQHEYNVIKKKYPLSQEMLSKMLKSLDSIFNRLQNIVSRLAILGVIIAQEDVNLNFLSSLPPEWNTHVVVWMNKPKIETMSIDDLYNNFKNVEQKIKKIVGTSSGGQNLAFMTPPSSGSTNDANTAYSQVSAATPSVNTASPQVCTASVGDNTVYAFMVENPNGSNVLHQDLEQIHEDDL
ncbi:hypothetical protein Tco_1279697, partial [Tanacetum coccineum]